VTFYFNLESLVLPDSQVHPFYTPSSRPIFGDVRRCSTMFGDVRECSARFGDVIRCSAMFGDVRRCSAMFDDVRRCSTMFGDVRRCSARFGDVIRCSAILSELQFTIVTVPFHVQDDLVRFSDLVYAATLICPLRPRSRLSRRLGRLDELVEYLPVCSMCDWAI